MIAPKMPSRTLDISDISTRIVPVQKAFSLITRRSTKTDGPRIQAKNCPPVGRRLLLPVARTIAGLRHGTCADRRGPVDVMDDGIARRPAKAETVCSHL